MSLRFAVIFFCWLLNYINFSGLHKPVPIYIYSGSCDALVSEIDAKNLSQTLSNMKKYKNFGNFNHCDFTYGINTRSMLYEDIMMAMDSKRKKKKYKMQKSILFKHHFRSFNHNIFSIHHHNFIFLLLNPPPKTTKFKITATKTSI